MASVDVLDWNKKKVGSVELDSSVFEKPVKEELLHTLVKWQLASRRKGTHATKTRSEVSGGGKKPFKQKGTGNARQGSSRSPLMPGGGITFGPQPRDYSYNLPKKVKKAGLSTALSYLLKEGKLFVVSDMSSKDGKTKELNERLEKFGLKKAVLVDEKQDENFKRASQNLSRFCYYSVEGINVYDLLKFDSLIITQSSLDKVAQRCQVGS